MEMTPRTCDSVASLNLREEEETPGFQGAGVVPEAVTIVDSRAGLRFGEGCTLGQPV